MTFLSSLDYLFMNSETAERLRVHCRETIGKDLRAIIAYGEEEGIVSKYIRDDLDHLVEDMSRDMLTNPFLHLHRAGLHVSNMFDHFSPPGASIHTFQDIILFNFPTSGSGGVVVSVEKKEEYISDLFPELEALVSEPKNKNER